MPSTLTDTHLIRGLFPTYCYKRDQRASTPAVSLDHCKENPSNNLPLLCNYLSSIIRSRGSPHGTEHARTPNKFGEITPDRH